eukprot:GHVT01020695.1.p2 GENE.GHVT01020695.1~~GHVT01020695.1.p2  ORF type:complete len:127 (-),score=10.81 GHVT01020695.1:860-1240(-)
MYCSKSMMLKGWQSCTCCPPAENGEPVIGRLETFMQHKGAVIRYIGPNKSQTVDGNQQLHAGLCIPAIYAEEQQTKQAPYDGQAVVPQSSFSCPQQALEFVSSIELLESYAFEKEEQAVTALKEWM